MSSGGAFGGLEPPGAAVLLLCAGTRRSATNDRVRIASVPVSMVVVGGILAAGVGAYFPPGPFFSYWIGSMIAFALGLMKLVDLVRPFKPKFEDLKD